MSDYMIYLLEVAATLSVCFVIYLMALRHQTFFAMNRRVLVGCIVTAIVLPLVANHLPEPEASQTAAVSIVSGIHEAKVTTVRGIVKMVPQKETDDPNVIYHTLRLLGFGFMGISLMFIVLRLTVEMAMLVKVLKSGRSSRCRKSGYTWIALPIGKNPYSWHQYLFASREDMKDDRIVAHELCHIRKRHSLEKLLSDLALALQWFNPFAWLLRRELECQQEFEADAAAIGEKDDKKPYLTTLLTKAAGRQRIFPGTCGLRSSILRERFVMMRRPRSDRGVVWRTLLFIPALMFLTFVMACQSDHIEKAYDGVDFTFSFPKTPVIDSVEIGWVADKANGNDRQLYVLERFKLKGTSFTYRAKHRFSHTYCVKGYVKGQRVPYYTDSVKVP